MANTILIKQFEENIWKHYYNGTDYGYILSKFYVKQDDNFGKFQIIEEGGSQRISYDIMNVSIQSFGGSVETNFPSDVELFQRLRQLMYPGFDYSGEIDPDAQIKANISQDIVADQSSIIKYPSVKAVFDFFTGLYFWIMTGTDITNNNVGNVNVKLQSTKKFRILNSADLEKSYIDENGNMGGNNANFVIYGLINGGEIRRGSGHKIVAKDDSGGLWEVTRPFIYAADYSSDITPGRLVSLSEITVLESSKVPYSGATGDVDLGGNSIKAFNWLDSDGDIFLDEGGVLFSEMPSKK